MFRTGSENLERSKPGSVAPRPSDRLVGERCRFVFAQVAVGSAGFGKYLAKKLLPHGLLNKTRKVAPLEPALLEIGSQVAVGLLRNVDGPARIHKTESKRLGVRTRGE